MNRFLSKFNITILLLTALVISIILLVGKCTDNKALLTAYQSSQVATKHWQDESGRWRAQTEVIQMQLTHANALHRELLDTYSDLLETNKRNIRKITELSTRTDREIILYRDTTINEINPVYTFQDPWWKGGLRQLSPNSYSLIYNSTDSLSLASYYRSNGWFKSKTLVSEVISHNPHTRIVGQRSFEFTKPRRIGLGAYAGVGATLQGNEIYFGKQIGAGITIRVF